MTTKLFRSIRTYTAILVLLAAVLSTSCAFIYITPDGTNATQDYNLSGFDSVSASSAFQITVTQGSTWSTSVTCDTALLDYLEVYILGDTLHIGLIPGCTVLGMHTLSATVTMPILDTASASSASSATINGFETNNSGTIQINASSASRVTATGINATSLSVNSSSASTVVLSGIHTSSLEANISSDSRCTVKNASLGNVVLNVSSASGFDGSASSTSATTLRAMISSASSASLNVTTSVTGSVSSASTLSIGGNPVIDVSTDLTSQVR